MCLDIVKDKVLTYEQKVLGLARCAENSLNILNISDEVKKYREENIICDLYEGNAPYRPRYIVVDFEKFMKEGSEFLRLNPPKDIWEAVNNLLIFYKHIPSITSFPVYIGNIDYLLEPFIKDEEEAYRAIKMFLNHIDRTITDSFCHANIGPKDTKAARLILKAERELENSVPNITLKYGEDTPDELALESIKTAMVVAKPSLANDEMFRKDLGNYGIASCYNGLKIGGGAYTLVRLNLGRLVNKAESMDQFFSYLLPHVVENMVSYIDERIRFLVEESNFFESSFLVREGFIDRDLFTGMFGMVGLAECVNGLFKIEKIESRFGHSKEADDLGVKIVETMENLLDKYSNPYCKCTGGKHLLHAQVGIDSDVGISPGCRIPIGEEPELYNHLIQSAKFHKYFPSGIGDIFPLEYTVNENLKSVLDIIKGSFRSGMRYISIHSSDCDVIRITGYLVKKSEIEKLSRGEQVLKDTVVLGKGAVNNHGILNRRVRSNESLSK
ncbi:YjjI family glycine radical enzyme [Anaeromicrobium sediminis]|uniref:YjjI family glycine radical enzyme n=1 Tax=Anaeromicrobium sediminis TaxID=1478221 RepID=A0A267MCH1_9FIRM|nr:YjjI family glycine radical enzyme [Anaeromicrobium sediminis]PAB57246.1 YjjI family glycine radical enzyme [Anaeromicrobium sediminis]